MSLSPFVFFTMNPCRRRVKYYDTTSFPFRIQTDNGTEFTYKYISDSEENPFDKLLSQLHISRVLIPPRTPWHNGKVERSHRNDQRYFYDWETFRSVQELNEKLALHLKWSNHKSMRTLDGKSPAQMLNEKIYCIGGKNPLY